VRRGGDLRRIMTRWAQEAPYTEGCSIDRRVESSGPTVNGLVDAYNDPYDPTAAPPPAISTNQLIVRDNPR
jgi:hypothetical protein